jgi:hypothetical protein
MTRTLSFLLLSMLALSLQGQSGQFTSTLYETYDAYREPNLGRRRIKHQDLQPLIDAIGARPGFEVRTVGRSIEGRALRLISVGEGDTDVFLWSQMHGNEPTATQAIFDILNFLASPDLGAEKKEILQSVRLHFLPMLNPDGAEVFSRYNTLGIDINRDALRLQSPEGRTLKRVRDSLQAAFGFNLHDQSTYYNAERTPKPATISYLAPAYNYEKDVNEVRANAMKVIGYMNGIIQKYAPGQVGKYNDDFEPRAFGDNIQKWGTSAILIESGGYPEDTEKQEIRKLNYVSILSAIFTIANGSYEAMSLQAYESIPENDRKLFDLKIEGVTYPLMGADYIMDIGIQRPEVDDASHEEFWYSSRVVDLGDLSTYYGYRNLDATGYRLEQAGVYPDVLPDVGAVGKLDFPALLRKGIAYVRVASLPKDMVNSPYPVHLISETYKPAKLRLQIGMNPTFVLLKSGKPEYVVVNGFLYSIPTGTGGGKNSLIYR